MKEVEVLVAGASGYLGKYITEELLTRKIKTRALVRKKEGFGIKDSNLEILEAQVTEPETLQGLLNGTTVLISTVGITRQKDGLTYMDVDFQANANLLEEARNAGVKKFIYISVLNGDKLRHLKGGAAKELFCDKLKESGLDYCIVRPNGFFSDMGDFLKMAKGGRVYLFGNGEYRLNPIHGKDLAKAVVDELGGSSKERKIGGPDLLTQNEIAEMALRAYRKPVRIVHLPDWIRRWTLLLIKAFTNEKTYGPIEFFMTVMVMDMASPCFGTHKLSEFYEECVQKENQSFIDKK